MTPERPEGLPETFEWDAGRGAWFAELGGYPVYVEQEARGVYEAGVGDTSWRGVGDTPLDALAGLEAYLETPLRISRAKLDAVAALVRALRSLVEPGAAEESAETASRAFLEKMRAPGLAAEVERLRKLLTCFKCPDHKPGCSPSYLCEGCWHEQVAEHEGEVERLRAERDEAARQRDRLREAALKDVRAAYCTGYHAGHHDTVEGSFSAPEDEWDDPTNGDLRDDCAEHIRLALEEVSGE